MLVQLWLTGQALIQVAANKQHQIMFGHDDLNTLFAAKSYSCPRIEVMMCIFNVPMSLQVNLHAMCLGWLFTQNTDLSCL